MRPGGATRQRSRSRVVAPLVALSLLAAGARAGEARRAAAGEGRRTTYDTSDDALDRLQDFFGPTLEANRKVFLGRVGMVYGFGAGARYPQIWLRDSATIVPLSRCLYGRRYLDSWLEEHLAQQKAGGELYDWIAGGPAAHFKEWAPRAVEVHRSALSVVSADKNTVEADQESSAVQAVATVFALTGDREWLRKSLAGRPLIERADAALESLLRERFDPATGLVTSGFSADWGDVSPAHPDQRAIYLEAETPRVVGLYTNAMAFDAARKLAGLHRALGNAGRAARWADRAGAIREALQRHLWQGARGFFRMHRLLEEKGDPRWDDSHIFALGGNALAALTGVAEDDQAARLFEVAEARRREHRISTIAATLLPSFPRGFFQHPVMAEEYQYQNGGQWDWFAGRFVLAEFERGHAARAYSHLLELARKAARNNGLFEWHTREGEGRGSAHYAGAAGALAGAVYQGLFGVSLDSDELRVTVRLAERPGEIHFDQPATGTFVEYRYAYDAARRVATLNYRSNHPRPGRVALLLPGGHRPRSVRLDGNEAPFAVLAVGRDSYVSLETTWPSHELRVALAPGRE